MYVWGWVHVCLAYVYFLHCLCVNIKKKKNAVFIFKIALMKILFWIKEKKNMYILLLKHLHNVVCLQFVFHPQDVFCHGVRLCTTFTSIYWWFNTNVFGTSEKDSEPGDCHLNQWFSMLGSKWTPTSLTVSVQMEPNSVPILHRGLWKCKSLGTTDLDMGVSWVYDSAAWFGSTNCTVYYYVLLLPKPDSQRSHHFCSRTGEDSKSCTFFGHGRVALFL